MEKIHTTTKQPSDMAKNKLLERDRGLIDWRDKVENEIARFVKEQFPGLNFDITLDPTYSVSRVFLVLFPMPKNVKVPRLPEVLKTSREVKRIIKEAKTTIVRPKLKPLVEFVQKARFELDSFSKGPCFLWFTEPHINFIFEKKNSILIDDDFVEKAKKTILLIEKLKKIFSRKIFKLILKKHKGILTEGFRVVNFDKVPPRFPVDFEPFIIPDFLLDVLFKVDSFEELKNRQGKNLRSIRIFREKLGKINFLSNKIYLWIGN